MSSLMAYALSGPSDTDSENDYTTDVASRSYTDAYKDVTDTCAIRTKNGIFVAMCDVACIPCGDESFYDYIVKTTPFKMIDREMKTHIESFMTDEKQYVAVSSKLSNISSIAYNSIHHIRVFLDSNTNNSTKICIDDFPVQKGPSGAYRLFYKTTSDHGAYRLEVSGSNSSEIVIKNTRQDTVAIDNVESMVDKLCQAPTMPPNVEKLIIRSTGDSTKRSIGHELILEISYAYRASNAPLEKLGSFLRGTSTEIAGNDWSQELWNKLTVNAKTHIPNWNDIVPVRLGIDAMMYHTWLENGEAYKRIFELFKLKKNSFDPTNKAEYMDRLHINHETISLYEVLQWIGDTMAYIISGSNGFWITKNFDENGCMYIERSKDVSRDLKYTVNAVVDNVFASTPKMGVFKLSDLVINYKDCVSFGKLAFVPHSGKEDPPAQSKRHFNMFVGYPVKFDRHLIVNLGVLEPLFYHIRHVLADGDIASFEYIVYWMAHIIQKPRDRTGVCLTFTSVQGAGKGIWWEWFGNRIIGRNQYLFLNSIENLFNRFNSEQECKLFTVLDEAQLYSVQRKNNDKFKSALTESTLRIEPKGSPVYTVANYNNFVMLTNQDLPVRVDISDRRHACFQVSNRHKGDMEYFDRLVSCQRNPIAIKHFYHFLEHIPLGNFKPQARIPDTQLKKDLKVASMPSPVMYLLEIAKGLVGQLMIEQNVLSFVSTDDLYLHYKMWAGNCFESKIQFSRVISTNLCINQSHGNANGKRCRGYKMSIQLLSEKLQSIFGEDILY